VTNPGDVALRTGMGVSVCDLTKERGDSLVLPLSRVRERSRARRAYVPSPSARSARASERARHGTVARLLWDVREFVAVGPALGDLVVEVMSAPATERTIWRTHERAKTAAREGCLIGWTAADERLRTSRAWECFFRELAWALMEKVEHGIEEGQRRSISADIRAEVWERSGGRCHYCGKELNPFRDFVVDHVFPWSRGGTDDVENLAAACEPCNISKGDRTPEEWLR
jgi:hypothetical protein